MKIRSWVDWEGGEERGVIYTDEAAAMPTVLSLLTGKAAKIELGARTPEEFIIRIPWNIAPQFKAALAEWLKGQDIRPADESRAQGKLEATRYHLEDLREILKLAPHGKDAKWK